MKGVKIILYLCLLFLLFALTDCTKDELMVSTGIPSKILPTSAEISGSILVGGNIKQYGHCYSKNHNPTVFDKRTELGIPPALGDYTSLLQGLDPSTTYYVKAYVSDKVSIVYGQEVSLKTASYEPPAITTSEVTFITSFTAVSGGEITEQAGIPVFSRGICWSTTPNPSISDNKTVNGSGAGSYVSYLTGLEANTDYYVRAYATNGGGTYYGNQVGFKTHVFSAEIPTVTTGNLSSVTATSAICEGNVTSEGTSPVTAKGVCWSASINPLVTNYTTVNGAGIGPYSGLISGLEPNTMYYVRAYATNNVGTAYGDQISFTTLQMPSAVTNAATMISSTVATLNGTVNANNSSTTVTFEYGTTTSYGSSIQATPSPLIGNAQTSVSASLTSLLPATTYHFKVVAANEVGTASGNDMSFTTSQLLTDADGNEYSAVTIGSQIWMTANLKTTKLNDNTDIKNNTDLNSWKNGTDTAYCWYNNNTSYKDDYGALYNWQTISTGKLCPTGWHVPSDDDFIILNEYLGGEDVAGGKLKETGTDHWKNPNNGASNASGFIATGAGKRDTTNNFSGLKNYGYFWTTSSDTTHADCWYLMYNSAKFSTERSEKSTGYSVRCVKD